MFASAATASGSMPLTAHSNARRLNNSKLICEISASSASLRCVSATLASQTACAAAGTYIVRLRPSAYTARYEYGPCNSPRRHRHPSLEHRRPSDKSTPRNVRSGSDNPAASRRRLANNWRTLKSLICEEAISLYVIR
jgi:hypothetical protein